MVTGKKHQFKSDLTMAYIDRKIIISNGYALLSHLIKRLYTNNVDYIMRRDLTLPIKTMELDSSLVLRELRMDDIPKLLESSFSNHNNAMVLDYLRLWHMLKADIKTGYVAVGADDQPRHACWLIDSKENMKLKKAFKGGLRPLRHDEVLFERFHTIEKYRREGLQKWSIAKCVEKSREIQAKWAFIYIRQSNIFSLKAASKNDFIPFMKKIDKWRLYQRQFYYIEVGSENKLDKQPKRKP